MLTDQLKTTISEHGNADRTTPGSNFLSFQSSVVWPIGCLNGGAGWLSRQSGDNSMEAIGLLVTLEARPGKEADALNKVEVLAKTPLKG
jgi:hypothetical protein